MKCFNRRFVALYLLGLLFAAPGFFALLSYYHPQWQPLSTTNAGVFVKSGVLIPELGQSKKWHLVLLQPSHCGKTCMETLDKLARTRLALGRRLYDVDLQLVLAGGDASSQEALLRQQGFEVIRLFTPVVGLNNGNKPMIYIASPQNHLVLSYADTVAPDAVYRDLKHLLSNTKSTKSL